MSKRVRAQVTITNCFNVEVLSVTASGMMAEKKIDPFGTEYLEGLKNGMMGRKNTIET